MSTLNQYNIGSCGNGRKGHCTIKVLGTKSGVTGNKGTRNQCPSGLSSQAKLSSSNTISNSFVSRSFVAKTKQNDKNRHDSGAARQITSFMDNTKVGLSHTFIVTNEKKNLFPDLEKDFCSKSGLKGEFNSSCSTIGSTSPICSTSSIGTINGGSSGIIGAPLSTASSNNNSGTFYGKSTTGFTTGQNGSATIVGRANEKKNVNSSVVEDDNISIGHVYKLVCNMSSKIEEMNKNVGELKCELDKLKSVTYNVRYPSAVSTLSTRSGNTNRDTFVSTNSEVDLMVDIPLNSVHSPSLSMKETQLIGISCKKPEIVVKYVKNNGCKKTFGSNKEKNSLFEEKHNEDPSSVKKISDDINAFIPKKSLKSSEKNNSFSQKTDIGFSAFATLNPTEGKNLHDCIHVQDSNVENNSSNDSGTESISVFQFQREGSTGSSSSGSTRSRLRVQRLNGVTSSTLLPINNSQKLEPCSHNFLNHNENGSFNRSSSMSKKIFSKLFSKTDYDSDIITRKNRAEENINNSPVNEDENVSMKTDKFQSENVSENVSENPNLSVGSNGLSKFPDNEIRFREFNKSLLVNKEVKYDLPSNEEDSNSQKRINGVEDIINATGTKYTGTNFSLESHNRNVQFKLSEGSNKCQSMFISPSGVRTSQVDLIEGSCHGNCKSPKNSLLNIMNESFLATKLIVDDEVKKVNDCSINTDICHEEKKSNYFTEGKKKNIFCKFDESIIPSMKPHFGNDIQMNSLLKICKNDVDNVISNFISNNQTHKNNENNACQIIEDSPILSPKKRGADKIAEHLDSCSVSYTDANKRMKQLLSLKKTTSCKNISEETKNDKKLNDEVLNNSDARSGLFLNKIQSLCCPIEKNSFSLNNMKSCRSVQFDDFFQRNSCDFSFDSFDINSIRPTFFRSRNSRSLCNGVFTDGIHYHKVMKKIEGRDESLNYPLNFDNKDYDYVESCQLSEDIGNVCVRAYVEFYNFASKTNCFAEANRLIKLKNNIKTRILKQTPFTVDANYKLPSNKYCKHIVKVSDVALIDEKTVDQIDPFSIFEGPSAVITEELFPQYLYSRIPLPYRKNLAFFKYLQSESYNVDHPNGVYTDDESKYGVEIINQKSNYNEFAFKHHTQMLGSVRFKELFRKLERSRTGTPDNLNWRSEPLTEQHRNWFNKYKNYKYNWEDKVVDHELCFCPTPNPVDNWQWNFRKQIRCLKIQNNQCCSSTDTS